MIISRTPFRISFFGGGTDYPVWFEEHGGETLGTSIDKYCYITVRYLPPFFEHKTRIVYAIEEWVNSFREIRHPSIRECMIYLRIFDGVEIHHQSDLLAKKGIGASSTFTVGLLNALGTLTDQGFYKEELARIAVFIEQERIKENVGCQDQYLAALGGFNHLKFNQDGTVGATKITVPDNLIDYMMLFDTKTSRLATDIAAEQIKQTPNKQAELKEMQSFVPVALGLLDNPRALGGLLDESWRLKKSLTNKVSTIQIDGIYDAAMRAGAWGGKLLGAGGGGYMLFMTDQQEQLKEALYGLRHIPFKFDNRGTEIIFDDERF